MYEIIWSFTEYEETPCITCLSVSLYIVHMCLYMYSLGEWVSGSVWMYTLYEINIQHVAKMFHLEVGGSKQQATATEVLLQYQTCHVYLEKPTVLM